MLADVLRHLAREAPGLALPRVVPALDGQPVAAGHGRPGRGSARAPADVGGRRAAGPGAPPDTRAAREPRTVPGGHGPRARRLRSPRGPSRAEVGPRAGGLVPRRLAPDRRPVAAGTGDALPRALRRGRACPVPPPAGRHPRRRQRLERARERAAGARRTRWSSVIDFGDMHHGLVVAEPAVAAAYALLGQADVLAAATAVVRGYHRAFPLSEDEIAVAVPADRGASRRERRELRARVGAAARRPVRHDQRGAGVGGARAARARAAGPRPRDVPRACGLPPLRDGAKATGWLRERSAGASPFAPCPRRRPERATPTSSTSGPGASSSAPTRAPPRPAR